MLLKNVTLIEESMVVNSAHWNVMILKKSSRMI